MFTKISVLCIIKDHIKTLKNNRTNQIYFPDIVLFFVVPAIIAAVMFFYLGVALNDSLVNALITSFSIFSALLFNLLLLVYDIAGKIAVQIPVTNPQAQQISEITQRREILCEIYVNVSFAILISTFIVVILLTYFLKPSNCNLIGLNVCGFQWLLALTTYYLSIQFLLTLFMILKRIYRLLAKAFESQR
jgi:hypothetical protein